MARAADLDPTEQYLGEIKRFPLLKREDETRLAQAIEAGVQAAAALKGDETAIVAFRVARGLSAGARGRLTPLEADDAKRMVKEGEISTRTFVQSNLRLVVSIARKFEGTGIPLLDLVQEGNMGLMHAVEKFDWRKGFKFSTYATNWIHQALQRGVPGQINTISFPRQGAAAMRRLSNARANLEIELGRSPTTLELAAELDWGETKVLKVSSLATVSASLDEEVQPDNAARRSEFVGETEHGYERVDSELHALELKRNIDRLPASHAEVVRLAFPFDGSEPLAPREIAERLAVGIGAVQGRLAAARDMLRHPAMVTSPRSEGLDRSL